MRNLGRDLRPFSWVELYGVALKLQCRDTCQNVEELARAAVKVPHLADTWWNTLLDHTERGILEQVPAITTATPDVVLCRGNRDGS